MLSKRMEDYELIHHQLDHEIEALYIDLPGEVWEELVGPSDVREGSYAFLSEIALRSRITDSIIIDLEKFIQHSGIMPHSQAVQRFRPLVEVALDAGYCRLMLPLHLWQDAPGDKAA